MRPLRTSVAYHKGKFNIFTIPQSFTELIDDRHLIRYFSDSSDLNRNANDNQSVSPIPVPVIEVDTINNNQVGDLNVPKKLVVNRMTKLQPRPERMSPRKSELLMPAPMVNAPTDLRLDEWLIKNNVDSVSRNIILNELFTYEDFIYEMEKEDLHQIGLK